MGLGSIATQNADSVTITGGSMTDMTSVTVSGAGRISGNGALPAGAVSAFAMTTAPTGWLECDGSAVSRSTYSDLYAAIGIQFGPGDTVTTFNLPDLRGQFIRGWDNGRGLDPGRSFSGDQSDAQESKINSFTTTEAVGGANPPGTSNIVNGNSSYRETGANDAGNGTAIRFNATVGTETRPTNVALMYCIKT
jgi:microcystin-dependent protein